MTVRKQKQQSNKLDGLMTNAAFTAKKKEKFDLILLHHLNKETEQLCDQGLQLKPGDVLQK